METPNCPLCKSNEKVEAITGCRCMSCPPWICRSCQPFKKAGWVGYEFYDEEEEEEEED